MKILLKGFSFIVLFTLIKCASAPVALAPEKYKEDKLHGLIIGSLSFPSEEAAFNGYFLRIVDQDTTTKRNLKEIQLNPDQSWKLRHNGQLEDKKTYVFTMMLPAGKHAVSGIRVYGNYLIATKTDVVPFTVPFEVKAGEAVYIGEILFNERASESDTIIKLNDKYNRDVDLLKRSKPGTMWDVRKSELILYN